jgi:hypothetical protein
MNICSKKNSVSHTKLVSQHSKGLKRSKSTEHLLPKKSTKKQLDRANTDENFYTHSLTKSKSMKSIKPKPKSLAKNELSTKKPKPKKSIDTKTVKKHRPVSSQDGNSILTVT